MAAACVAGGAGHEAEVITSEAEVPVKNTFIHFGAGRARSLRVCVTDPEDPKLWQKARAPTEPGNTSPAERPAAITEECSGSISGFNEDLLHIQTPEVSPRHTSSSPWSAPSPLGSVHTSGLSRSTPASTPQAVMTSNTAASCSTLTPASSPQVTASDAGHSFKFTLRLADDVGLGIDLAADSTGGLRVQGVLPNGAIDSWNRRCLDGSATAGKVVHPGDALVCVNGKTDSRGMLWECRSKLLLSMTFVRKGEDLSAPNSASDTPGARVSGRDANKVYLQISTALEGERLHASKSLMQGGP